MVFSPKTGPAGETRGVKRKRVIEASAIVYLCVTFAADQAGMYSTIWCHFCSSGCIVVRQDTRTTTVGWQRTPAYKRQSAHPLRTICIRQRVIGAGEKGGD